MVGDGSKLFPGAMMDFSQDGRFVFRQSAVVACLFDGFRTERIAFEGEIVDVFVAAAVTTELSPVPNPTSRTRIDGFWQ